MLLRRATGRKSRAPYALSGANSESRNFFQTVPPPAFHLLPKVKAQHFRPTHGFATLLAALQDGWLNAHGHSSNVGASLRMTAGPAMATAFSTSSRSH